MVADGIGERKAWVRQGSRQREYLCSPDGEPVSAVVIVFVATVALVLSALHEPPYTEPYVRWCGRTAEGDSASYPILPPSSRNIESLTLAKRNLEFGNHVLNLNLIRRVRNEF